MSNIEVTTVSAGLYAPVDDPKVVFLNPGEILRIKQLPDTQEMRLGLYQAYKENYNATGVEVILIAEDDVESSREFINNHYRTEEQSNDEQETE